MVRIVPLAGHPDHPLCARQPSSTTGDIDRAPPQEPGHLSTFADHGLDSAGCGLTPGQFAAGLRFLDSMELPAWMQATGWQEQAGLVQPSMEPSSSGFQTDPPPDVFLPVNFTRYRAMLGIADELSFCYDDRPRGWYDGFHWLCWKPASRLQSNPEGMAALLQQPILQFGALVRVSWDTGKLLILTNRGDISTCLQRRFRASEGVRESMADAHGPPSAPEVGRLCGGENHTFLDFQ